MKRLGKPADDKSEDAKKPEDNKDPGDGTEIIRKLINNDSK